MKNQKKIMHNLNKIFFIFLILISYAFASESPEIHYLEPSTIPQGISTNVTIVGNNFNDNLEAYLSSNKMDLLSTWASIQAIEDMFIYKEKIFLACGIKGLIVFQIQDPLKPAAIVGSFQSKTAITNVLVDNNYCYVADNSKLYILDINNIAQPILKSEIVLLSKPLKINFKDDYLYVNYGVSGAQIIKTKEKEKRVLKIVTQLTSIESYCIALKDNYMYSANGEKGFSVYDNKNPEKPLLINTFEVTGFVDFLFVENNYIYLTTNENGILVFDISSKTNPIFLKKIDIPDKIIFFNKDGDYLYAVSSSKIFAMDISNLSKLGQIKSWQNNVQFNKAIGQDGLVYSIDQSGNFQVLANMWKINDYRFMDTKLITIMVSKEIPFEDYDLIIIDNKTTKKCNKEKAIKVTKPLPKINFITPSTVVEGEKGQISLIGQNFSPGANILIDTTLCNNIEVYSQAKIKASYPPNLKIGTYDITLINPDEQKTTSAKAFTIIEKTLSLDNVSPNKISVDDRKRQINITGNHLDKTDRVSIWGNGPYRLASCDTPGNATSVFVAQNYCFIADELAGLSVIDIANPAEPVMIGNENTPGMGTGFAFYHNWVFLADGEYGIQMIDVSHPDKPLTVWSCDTPGFAYNLVIHKNHLFVADGKSGLNIFAIENQYNLTSVAKVTTLGAVYSLAIKDNYLFIASGDIGKHEGDGIVVMDISEISKPKMKFTIPTMGSANAIQIVKNLLFIADGEAGLLIFDITDPGKPVQHGSFDLKVNLFNVFVDNNAEYAYAAAGRKGIYIFDVKFPNNPFPIACFRTIDSANSIVVRDNLAYVAGGKAGLEIIDVSNPINPMNINYLGRISQAIDVTSFGDYCYLADEFYGLVVINTKSTRFKIENEIKIDGKAMGITIYDKYIYLAAGNGGLKTFSLINNPNKPELINEFKIEGYVYNVHINNNRAYLSCVDNGVMILDIKNPSEPTLLGSFKTQDKAYQSFVKDNYIYVADYTGGLFISDISKILKIKKVSNLNTKGFANDVIVKDTYAYIAASDMGLIVVDVSDVQNPKIVSSCKLEGSANGIEISDNIAALACVSNGVFFVDITDPLRPIVIGFYNTLGTAYNLYIADQKIHIADNNFGLNSYYMPTIINKFISQDKNNLIFEAPYMLPTGSYNLTLINGQQGMKSEKYKGIEIIK
ncbi:IPT/TIG domain-containing protein [Candidatus Poribacteria bacterium]|nr:IPT/TIG domain-containing protein [Candidatus Poribacteria bacterium]